MKFNWKRALSMALSLVVVMALGVGVAKADFSVPYSRVARLEVYVDGVLNSNLSMDSVVCGEVVKMTAPTVSGKSFSHWAFGSANGTVASTRGTYQFAINADTDLYAVYEGNADKTKSAVAFSSVTKEERDDGEYIRMTAAYSLPGSVDDPTPNASNPVLGEVGVRYTTNRMLGISDATRDLIADPVTGFDLAEILKSGKVEKGVHATSDSFYYAMGDWTLGVKNPGDAVHVYAVAYVTYGDQTVFSEVKNLVYGDLPVGYVLDANMSEPFSFE